MFDSSAWTSSILIGYNLVKAGVFCWVVFRLQHPQLANQPRTSPCGVRLLWEAPAAMASMALGGRSVKIFFWLRRPTTSLAYWQAICRAPKGLVDFLRMCQNLCTKYAWTTCCNVKQCVGNNSSHYYYCCCCCCYCCCCYYYYYYHYSYCHCRCYCYCYYYQGDQVVLIARSKHPPWGSKLLVIRIANISLHPLE